jgi:RNA polymerase sigma-70 factor (ECF subfamily)
MSDSPEPSGTSLTLLQRLRANEPEAWRAMVQLYSPLICHWCARGGVRGPDVDDVLQDVLREASSHLADFRRERAGDTFRGWLRGITRHMVGLHFRRRGRHPQAGGGTNAFSKLQEIADDSTSPEEDDPSAEVDGLYRRAMNLIRGEFEEKTWRAFWQTVVDGRSPVDIAAEMGVTPAAVRKAKSRVLLRLKQEFGDLLR